MDLEYVMLALAEGCGPGLIPALLCPDAAPAELLRHPPPRLPPAARRRLEAPDLATHARALLDRAARDGLELVTPEHSMYPPRLRCSPLRPLVLFARGDVAALRARPAVAIVGSRTPTPYGRSAVTDFARALAEAGVAIWSGLAAGIDAAAHRAALDAGAVTVAVLAGGLDQIYPRAHQPLAAQIAASGGALLAECPPGRRATRGHFPRRNRILCAADAVLVIEAGLASGSLHTARFAADAGIDVFALPGSYLSPRSRGCHDLIADGAQVARDPSDLLRRLGVDRDLRGEPSAELALSADEAAIVQVLQSGPRPWDLVLREAGVASEAFTRAVHALRRNGALELVPGDLLALARPISR